MNLTEDEIARRLRQAYQAEGTVWEGAGSPPSAPDPKCAAVLVALANRPGGWHLLLTRRTETVEHHKGQVSFPGGGCEPGETTPEQTALREAGEEVGLQADRVRLLGRLNALLTSSQFRVTPVVGVIPWPCRFRRERSEVQRIFTLPLAWLARRENWQERPYTPDGFARPVPVLVYRPYAGEILWGVSARITHQFLQVLGLLKE